jgi:hypothetical protein
VNFGEFENEADRTHRYWKAAISCLPTPEKREIAEEFLRTKLEGGGGADTLFALIILLEANGAFLLNLPEKIHGEIAQPMAEQVIAFRNELLTHFERQQNALIAFDKVQESIAVATALIEQGRQELAFKIRMAAANVDPSGMANQISRTLENTILHLLKFSLGNLEKSTGQAIQATHAAERSVETWRKVHLRGIVLTSILIATLIAGGILCWGWWRMEDRYRTRLAAQVVRLSETDDAYRQFLWLGISVHLAPWEDESGKPVKDGYTITIDDVETAALKATERGNKVVVMLKAQLLVKRLESPGKNLEKPDPNGPPERRKSR